VDGRTRLQHIDGFGFSEAFQRSNILHGSLGLSPANQQKVLDLLFSTRDGAGFSILRNGIGSSPDSSSDHMVSIEPVSPGSPDAPPQYVFDGSDNSEVWLSQQAMRFGVKQIYADAWSAPGYMKTTGTDGGGGYLCGVPGQACASGDWRQAYANYLVKYIQFYQQAGVRISAVGFLNEPEIAPSYASMLSTPAQAADFIKILGRTIRASGLDTKIACCDSEGWGTAAGFTSTILGDPSVAKYVSIVSSHGYTAPPNVPLTSARPVWETEWAVFNPFDPAWDDGTNASGFTWAQNVFTALTAGDVNAFLYWWGASASTANSGIIRLVGDSYATSGRFWALAAFSRFIRPGAVRIGTTGDSGSGVASTAVESTAVESTAFRNRDGSVVVELLNTTTAAAPVDVTLRHVRSGDWARSYVTDATDQMTAQPLVPVRDGQLATSAPPRSVVTIVLPADR